MPRRYNALTCTGLASNTCNWNRQTAAQIHHKLCHASVNLNQNTQVAQEAIYNRYLMHNLILVLQLGQTAKQSIDWKQYTDWHKIQVWFKISPVNFPSFSIELCLSYPLKNLPYKVEIHIIQLNMWLIIHRHKC